jgi:hypothetical protein
VRLRCQSRTLRHDNFTAAKLELPRNYSKFAQMRPDKDDRNLDCVPRRGQAAFHSTRPSSYLTATSASAHPHCELERPRLAQSGRCHCLRARWLSEGAKPACADLRSLENRVCHSRQLPLSHLPATTLPHADSPPRCAIRVPRRRSSTAGTSTAACLPPARPRAGRPTTSDAS